MKRKFSAILRVTVALVLGLSFSLMTVLPAMADTATVDLGSAANFAVLASSGITNTGTTNITGDIGSSPTYGAPGGTITLSGTNHGADGVTATAKTDLAAAYTNAAGRTPDTTYPAAYDLGGLTLTTGVYKDPSSFGITGVLKLDAGDNPNAVFIFQAGSTLGTAAGSQVILIGGAQASNVFWQVGTSATLGTDSIFMGTILADQSITINTGATVYGRALASGAAVTLNANTISVPPTWVSYSDPGHAIACDNFDDFGSEHIVYMSGTVFAYSHSYRVAYYDGGNVKRATDDVTSSASGNVSSQRTFAAETDTAGTWHVIVSETSFTPPNDYDSSWASTLVTDTFNVQNSAIPEFPTVISVMVVLSLCFVMYLWMRHRTVKVHA
jgi:hypothetical protein